MRSFIPLLAAFVAPTGCAAVLPPGAPSPVEGADGLSRAALGQTVSVGGPKVTPLVVLEDSRCPAGVRCVWRGQVRLRVRVGLGRGDETRELTQGQAIPVADGTLELVEVRPDRFKDDAIAPADYRFAFRFMGGL